MIHAQIVTSGLSSNLSLATKLISISNSVTVRMDYARQVFDAMPEKDVFIWNTVIRGYADSGPCKEALVLYCQMHRDGRHPDHFTFPFVVRSCGVLAALFVGKQAHCNAIKNCFDYDIFVQTSLVAMYSQCGDIDNAQLIFNEMELKNTASWTAMIAGYVQNAYFRDALVVFHQMLESEVRPNSITLVSILPACANTDQLYQGMLIHAYAFKLGLDADISFMNALISMYSKCKNVDISRSLFDRMEFRNLVSWNSMIAAYENNDQPRKALKLFRRMKTEGVNFDYITMVSVISACAKLGALNTGRRVHELVEMKGLSSNPSITHALLDMYAKCGSVELARKVFDSLNQKTVVSWSSMIGAYAAHGHGKEAMLLFTDMHGQGVKPNGITFTAILTACSHAGLVEEGKKHFDSMTRYFNLVPGVEHYTCMVDLLGRAGRLVEAYDFIQKMPIQPDADVWAALLGACRIHRNLDIAELVAEKISKLDHQTINYYVLLSNIYAEAGRWDDVARLRMLIEKLQLRKIPGRSSLEIIKDSLHSFQVKGYACHGRI
ncbi:Pentatricopeptide repeat-containing protein [Nymphaea thermarum]|nr:Pentatricopeptide repeat-containing protein [Nymphaea thermarum]